jgi:hypothetical protein
MRKKLAGGAFVAAVATAALSATVVGCGGGSSTQTNSRESYTDAVCNIILQHVEQISPLLPTMPPGVDPHDYMNSNPEGMGPATSRVGSMCQDIARDLRGLEPPVEVEAQHERMISLYVRIGEHLDGVARAMEQPPEEASATIEAMSDEGDSLNPSFIGWPDSYDQSFYRNEACSNAGSIAPVSFLRVTSVPPEP